MQWRTDSFRETAADGRIATRETANRRKKMNRQSDGKSERLFVQQIGQVFCENSDKRSVQPAERDEKAPACTQPQHSLAEQDEKAPE